MKLAEAVETAVSRDWVQKHIQILEGVPVFRGTRVTLYAVLALLAEGARLAEVYTEFPELKREHVKAGLCMAAELLLLAGLEKKHET
jgi:uncharacterized protein (DUF433 family)